MQYDNYLIASDYEDHCIIVFDRDGNFVYKFGKQGQGEGQFDETRCLSVNKAGHLMVCDSSNHRVQVFELSGKFLAEFGAPGSGIGEFDDTFSPAVLGDGRIVVTDWGTIAFRFLSRYIRLSVMEYELVSLLLQDMILHYLGYILQSLPFRM